VNEQNSARELARERAFLRSIIDALPGFVCVKDQDSRFLLGNRALAEAYGTTTTDIVGKRDQDFSAQSSEVDAFLADDRFVMQHRKPRLIPEERITYADGSVHTLSTQKIPLFDEDGQCQRVLVVTQDITEQKQAEERLNAMAEMLDTAPNAIIVSDFQGRILYANRSTFEMHGYEEEEFMALTLPQIAAPGSGPLLADHMRMVAERGEARFEARRLRKDGTTFPMEIHVKRVAWGGAQAMLGISTDITERKREEATRQALEEQLRQALKMEAIGQLAGGVAHDFNNLLAAILGNVELALRVVGEDNPLRKRLLDIEHASDRAAALTKKLLAFGRKQLLNPQPLDLNCVVEGIAHLLERLLGEDIAIRLDLKASIGMVFADSSQIEQVLINLAVNARDAMMPAGGTLSIATAGLDSRVERPFSFSTIAPESHVVLSVSDTGCGMDEQTQSRIFEPFFTTKEQGKGTGLGLATVYGIVKQSGGEIAVTSALGRGTKFEVFLQRAKAKAESLDPRTEQGVSIKGKVTVLVVEDDQAVLQVTQQVLSAAGFTVLTASNGLEALERVAEHRGDLHVVLTDVVMPKMNGKELAERLATVRPGLKVIFMSGYTDGTILRNEQNRDVAFLAKPIRAADLQNKIREVLNS
jgi:PAS domain S-box-containing protein